MKKCPICGGELNEELTTYTVDLKTTLLVVRNVPADVCSRCGTKWLSADVSEKLERITEEARKKRPELEIVNSKKPHNLLSNQISLNTLQQYFHNIAFPS